MRNAVLDALAVGLVTLASAGCSKDNKPTPEPRVETKSASIDAIRVESPQVDTPTSATKHLAGDHFTLDLASTDCKSGSECKMTIKLSISDEYHVNKEYPYRFIATDTPGVEFLGKTDKMKFTKEAGDFVADGEKSGTMTVRFKPAAAGKTKIGGTYKLSLCSADQCQIEEPKVELLIPAS